MQAGTLENALKGGVHIAASAENEVDRQTICADCSADSDAGQVAGAGRIVNSRSGGVERIEGDSSLNVEKSKEISGGRGGRYI